MTPTLAPEPVPAHRPFWQRIDLPVATAFGCIVLLLILGSLYSPNFLSPEYLLQQLKVEAPPYAKLLPALPRLLNDYLQHKPHELRRELDSLLAEQRRTNRLLQAILYGGLGFVLGLLAMQLLVRVQLW